MAQRRHHKNHQTTELPAMVTAEQRGAEIGAATRWSRLSEQIFRVDKWGVCRV